MPTLHIIPIGPRPNEWYWLEDGCRCGREAQLRVNPRGVTDADPITYECRRCGIWLATAYDVPSLDRAIDLKAEAHHAVCRNLRPPINRANVTNTHRGYRCRSDGRRYPLDALWFWLRRESAACDD